MEKIWFIRKYKKVIDKCTKCGQEIPNRSCHRFDASCFSCKTKTNQEWHKQRSALLKNNKIKKMAEIELNPLEETNEEVAEEKKEEIKEGESEEVKE